jgi:hypothetical protein
MGRLGRLEVPPCSGGKNAAASAMSSFIVRREDLRFFSLLQIVNYWKFFDINSLWMQIAPTRNTGLLPSTLSTREITFGESIWKVEHRDCLYEKACECVLTKRFSR